MLIEFKVKNFRSIREEQTFTMVAGSQRGGNKLENNLFQAPFSKKLNLLKSSVIYGANASGKSNLIAALAFVQSCVLNSAKNQPGDKIDRYPFAFDEFSKSENSEFEVIFAQDGIRYQYGFACDDNRFTEEWLLIYPKGNSRALFERLYDPKTKKDEWHYPGKNLKGSKKLWESNTGPNTLYLSRAAGNNSEQLLPPFLWFRELVILGCKEELSLQMTGDCCLDQDGKEKVIGFLNLVDIPVNDIQIEERRLDPEDTPDEIIELLSKLKKISSEEIKLPTAIKRVNIIHTNKTTGHNYTLPLIEESDGTRKMFSYAAPWLETLERGGVFVIDEFNNSLHPNLVNAMVKMVNSKDFNKNNAQLIFTTHDSTLLNLKTFRRDQIWFTEKDQENVTVLYSLAEYTPRTTESIGKGYLLGRYGAIPYIKGIN